jgi:hypothetical protein
MATKETKLDRASRGELAHPYAAINGNGGAAGRGGAGETRPDAATMRIADLSALKAIVLYGATLAFAGLYAYFMEQIATAAAGTQPGFSTAMVGAAAALAGTLGSAFALAVGVPVVDTNEQLGEAIKQTAGKRVPLRLRLRQLLSLQPAGADQASWPQTFGVWAYAVVATAVATVYILRPGETPGSIKALAVAFGGYVIALMTAAYGLSKKS